MTHPRRLVFLFLNTLVLARACLATLAVVPVRRGRSGRFDDGSMTGLLETIAYMDLSKVSAHPANGTVFGAVRINVCC